MISIEHFNSKYVAPSTSLYILLDFDARKAIHPKTTTKKQFITNESSILFEFYIHCRKPTIFPLPYCCDYQFCNYSIIVSIRLAIKSIIHSRIFHYDRKLSFSSTLYVVFFFSESFFISNYIFIVFDKYSESEYLTEAWTPIRQMLEQFLQNSTENFKPISFQTIYW